MDTRDKIVAAAISIFASKGKHGARMEEIAAKARINKAMLYYYYTTKENLYREVLVRILDGFASHMAPLVDNIFASTNDPIERFKRFYGAHMETFSRESERTKIFIEAIISEPKDVKAAMKATCAGKRPPRKSLCIFEDGIAKKAFRKVDPKQVFISIIGMDLFFLGTKTLIESFIDLKDEKTFLQERKKSIIDLILYGIVERKPVPCVK